MTALLRYSLALALAYFAAMPSLAIAVPVTIDSIPEDGHAGVILAYSRIGEDAYPDNSIETDLFLDHLDELTSGKYNIIALPALIDALKNKTDLPPRTVAITFENAYKSALDNAVPQLLKRNIPFTVFYASDQADNPSEQYMSWDDLKSLSREKNVTLGILPSSYDRPQGAPDADIRAHINKAKQAYRDHFGTEAAYFSYPYGEYSTAYKKIVGDSGFTAAFGMQSGAASESSDFFALPRFTMTEKYGDIERFRMAAQALPFPAFDQEPADTYITNPKAPVIGFTVPAALAPGLKGISCFISGVPETNVHVLDNRVELRPSQAIEEDHARVNCTLPGPVDADADDDDAQAWRWFGMLVVNPAGNAATDAPQDSASDTSQPSDGLQ